MKTKIALVGLAHFLIQSESIATQKTADSQLLQNQPSVSVSVEINKISKNLNALPIDFLKIVDSDGPTSIPVPTHETLTIYS